MCNMFEKKEAEEPKLETLTTESSSIAGLSIAKVMQFANMIIRMV